MQKDFDEWNVNKKQIQVEAKNKLYHARDIWWCSLGVNIGFEEDGSGPKGERPVLIIKGFSKQVCWIVPLTTSLKKSPYNITIGSVGGRESSVVITQIRLIDNKRLSNQIGFLDEEKFETIRKAIRDLI